MVLVEFLHFWLRTLVSLGSFLGSSGLGEAEATHPRAAFRMCSFRCTYYSDRGVRRNKMNEIIGTIGILTVFSTLILKI